MIRVHLLKNTCEALGRPLRCWPGANHIFAQGETAPILLNFLIPIISAKFILLATRCYEKSFTLF
jgi:hypothetical protein